MLPDPLTIDASYITAADQPKVSAGEGTCSYQLTVGSVRYRTTISHTTAKGRRRSVVRLDGSKIVADPYVPTQNVEDTTSAYLVIDRSERLVTDADVVAHVKELLGVLAAAAFANVTTTRIAQIVGGES